MAEITLDKLCHFSEQTNTLITVDAPLYGIFMILNGKVLGRASTAEPEKIGLTTGFKQPEEIVSEASRFWLQQVNGIRARRTREEMANMLQQH